jgi:biotin carboxyl carrier protein
VTVDLEVRGVRRTVEVSRSADGWVAWIDGRVLDVQLVPVGSRWMLRVAEGEAEGAGLHAIRSHDVAFEPGAPGGGLLVHVDGHAVPVRVDDPRAARPRGGGRSPASGGAQTVVAPMPGRVVKVLVAPGESVAARQPLVVVEAMKMENELRAPGPGTVREVRVTDGAPVESGAVLVVFES